ncbi:MAG TPA: glycosyltransferase family 4 protein [Alphaproteobacteria bacterium]|nr:glycosyltransferase family 4 protein [Alphaproteobacteria bacterium]
MKLTVVVPGSLETPTGGYRYDRQVVVGLRAAGHGVTVLTLGESYPQPDAATLQASYRALSRLSGPVVIDGLALGAMPDIADHLPAHAPLIALVHHPLALESGLDPALAEKLRQSEREALAHARHVIVTSPPTGKILAADYGVPRERISVALPGVGEAPLAQGSGGQTIQLLSVGSVIARKGHDLLIEALAPLADLPWRLTIVGDATRDETAAQTLRTVINKSQLQDRVTLTGALSEEDLARCYHAADLFVLASHYEGYGMVFSEALAHGLPIVATAVGEAATLLPQTAGKLVAPGDTKGLSEALRGFIMDGDRRAAARRGAQAARDRLPRWADCVTVFEKVLRSV